MRNFRKNPIGLTRPEINGYSDYVGTSDRSDTSRFALAQMDAERLVRSSAFFRSDSPPLFPYQLAGVANYMERALDENGSARMGIFDPMGVGKTRQGVGVMLAMSTAHIHNTEVAPRVVPFANPFPVIIVCPRAVIDSWVRDIDALCVGLNIIVPPRTLGQYNSIITESRSGDRPTNNSISRIDIETVFSDLTLSFQNPAAVVQTHFGDPNVIVFNYEQLNNPNLLAQLGANVRLGLMIVDEAHRITNTNIALYQSTMALVAHSSSSLFITGTPIKTSVFDPWPIYRAIERSGPTQWFPPYANAQGLDADIQAHSQSIATPQDWFVAPARNYTTFTSRGATVRDIDDVNDAPLLRPLLQRAGVRRTRRAIRESRTVPEELLQPDKDRLHYLVPGRLSNLQQSQQNVWNRYVQETDRAVTELLNRFQAAPFRRFRDPSIQSLLALETAIQNLDRDLRAATTPPMRQMPFNTYMTQVLQNQRVQRSITNFQQAARRAYVVVPETSGTQPLDLENVGFDLVESFVRDFQNQHDSKDIVFFTPRISRSGQPGTHLNNLIAQLSQGNNRRVYVFSGDRRTLYVNNVEVSQIDATILADAFRWPRPTSQAELLAWEQRTGRVRDEAATAIITRSAEVGIGLPSADVMAILGRMPSPFKEDQVEDRINRAGRGRNRNVEIYYFTPDDFFGYTVAQRAENRRLAGMLAMGDVPGGTNPRSVGSDLAMPLELDLRTQLANLIQNAPPGVNVITTRRMMMQLLDASQRPDAFIRETAGRVHRGQPPAFTALPSKAQLIQQEIRNELNRWLNPTNRLAPVSGSRRAIQLILSSAMTNYNNSNPNDRATTADMTNAWNAVVLAEARRRAPVWRVVSGGNIQIT